MRKAVVVALLVLFIFLGAIVIDLYLSKDNVTVSGKAGVYDEIAPNVQTVEFTDTQTGTTSHFTFARQTYYEGNYSVTLKNGHTYNVYISYSILSPNNPKTQFITTFTVNSPAGQTAITKNFAYPNLHEDK